MRCGLAWCLVLPACGFHGAASPELDGSADAAPDGPPWWDTAYAARRPLIVTPGAVRPDKGYAGYTVRYVGPLAGAREDCSDVRVVTWDGAAWTERTRHMLTCGTAGDLRFALPDDIADGADYRGAYLYYDNLQAAEPAAADGTAVYLWWDPATRDRSADYVHGRMDNWLVEGYDDSLRWTSAGMYTYDNGDDRQSSYRRAVDERDVLVEVSLFHTGCYPINMQTGVCARGVILSGSGASELANHYYCTSRAQNPMCANTDEAIYDGDIVETDNEILAYNNPTNPPAIQINQWRKQALGVFGVNPTELRFWDADTAWPALATPPAAALLTSGQDADDYESRGFAGVMTAQDKAQLRDLVIRRYVEPEPAVTAGDEQRR